MKLYLQCLVLQTFKVPNNQWSPESNDLDLSKLRMTMGFALDITYGSRELGFGDDFSPIVFGFRGPNPI
jgi:hypothetical protein